MTLGASCGESNIDAIHRLQPRGAELRSRLAEVSLALPAPGSLSVARLPHAPLSPPLVLDYEGDTSTGDVLMEAQLTRPERDLSAELDLLLSIDLLSCLLWTGPRNPLDPSVWDDSTGLGRDCERAFALPWLAVVRTIVYELPERIELELYVVDTRNRHVVAAIPLALAGRYAKGDVGRGRFAAEALRQLRSDAFVVARCATLKRLAALPGARITREKSWMAEVDQCSRPPATFLEVAPLRSVQ